MLESRFLLIPLLKFGIQQSSLASEVTTIWRYTNVYIIIIIIIIIMCILLNVV